MPITVAQGRRYFKKLTAIAANFDRLEVSTLRSAIQLLRNVRSQIAGQLIDTDFSRFRIAEQQRALDDIIDRYDSMVRALAHGASHEAFRLGERATVEPLQDAGIGAAFFRPSEAQVNIIAQFSADLIGGVSEIMRSRINTSIRLNALGGSSAIQAMKDITVILGIPSKPKDIVKGIAYEAERILRTEVNRTYNLATHAQQTALAKDVPGLRKQWIASADLRTRDTHLEAHGQTVHVKDKFHVGGFNLAYPLDPAGPPQETINCRCTSITVIPGIVLPPSPLDPKIEAEIARRKEVEKAKIAARALKVEPLSEEFFAAQTVRAKNAYIGDSELRTSTRDPRIQTFTPVAQKEAKDAIVTRLADETGMYYWDANKGIRQWANTSNDEDLRSLSIQKAASERFGVPLSDWQQEKYDKLIKERNRALATIRGGDPSKLDGHLQFLFEDMNESTRDVQFDIFGNADAERMITNFIDSIYEETQRRFREAGITHVTLYRGVHLDRAWEYSIGEEVTITGNTLESWTLEPWVTNIFGSVAVKENVPVEQILSTARTGWGSLSEWEFILIGQKDATVIRNRRE